MSKIKTITYNESNHTKNNYKKKIGTMDYNEVLSEYNKLRILMSMMKHTGVNSVKPYPDKSKQQENIKVIKYKYNMICQEITRRRYTIMNENYRRYNERYHSR
jgi:hypothetical protein